MKGRKSGVFGLQDVALDQPNYKPTERELKACSWEEFSHVKGCRGRKFPVKGFTCHNQISFSKFTQIQVHNIHEAKLYYQKNQQFEIKVHFQMSI